MIKKPLINFNIVFELLIWFLYVSLYKYSYYLDHDGLPIIRSSNFPYLPIGVYSICSTLYLIPYYRWAVPYLLEHKRYWILAALTLLWFVFINSYNQYALSFLFEKATAGNTVNQFFVDMKNRSYLDFNLMMTDFIAFFCIALSRFSFQSEEKRHQIETDHLQIQLSMLKAQLQPHFLFNTLNSLYGMSLQGSKDTSRFILLLSQMMQYILYDCEQEKVSLKAEADFLNGYFELEQKKYPNAAIDFVIPVIADQLKIPPLLFLPLVENAFKHGRHKLQDGAGVTAELQVSSTDLLFRICNDQLEHSPSQFSHTRGGIGLVNIRKRLELYYPGQYQLQIEDGEEEYMVELKIAL